MKLKSFLEFFWSNFKVVLIAAVLSLLLRTYVAEARVILGPSMMPTLESGDLLLVEKFSFRMAGLERGDVVIFDPPPAAHSRKDYVKRVIGLPGETVEMLNGTVYINGVPLSEDYIGPHPAMSFAPLKVPEDSVFVMGDNRGNSYDSREWGFLPEKSVVGRALIRIYPLRKIGSLPK
ncbi:MAG: signal peptidase I [Bacillota bacterium]